MEDNLLNIILDAEEKADEMIASTNESVRKNFENTQLEIEKIKDETVSTTNLENKNIFANAQMRCEANSKKEINDCIEHYNEEKGKIIKDLLIESKKIAERIVNGNS